MPDQTQNGTPLSAHAAPEIVEFYRDYVPPAYVKRVVEELVASVPSKYLSGLKTILLTNRAALTRDQRRQKIFQRGRGHKLVQARGSYYRATRSRQAFVTVIVNNTIGYVSRPLLRIPLFRHFFIGEVLYHEIGHHIHAAHKPVYDGKENVAEDWARKLGRLHMKRRFWYFVPFMRPLVSLLTSTSRVLTWVSRNTNRRK